MKKNIFFVMVSLFFIACATGGKYFKFEDAKKVKIGDSREVVYNKMNSKPYLIRTISKDGESLEVFVYTYVNISYATKSLSFVLKEGIVTEVPYIPESVKD